MNFPVSRLSGPRRQKGTAGRFAFEVFGDPDEELLGIARERAAKLGERYPGVRVDRFAYHAGDPDAANKAYGTYRSGLPAQKGGEKIIKPAWLIDLNEESIRTKHSTAEWNVSTSATHRADPRILMRDVVTHEFGHAAHRDIAGSTRNYAEVMKILRESFGPGIITPTSAADSVGGASGIVGRRIRSAYGTSSLHEAFAETFARAHQPLGEVDAMIERAMSSDSRTPGHFDKLLASGDMSERALFSRKAYESLLAEPLTEKGAHLLPEQMQRFRDIMRAKVGEGGSTLPGGPLKKIAASRSKYAPAPPSASEPFGDAPVVKSGLPFEVLGSGVLDDDMYQKASARLAELAKAYPGVDIGRAIWATDRKTFMGLAELPEGPHGTFETIMGQAVHRTMDDKASNAYGTARLIFNQEDIGQLTPSDPFSLASGHIDELVAHEFGHTVAWQSTRTPLAKFESGQMRALAHAFDVPMTEMTSIHSKVSEQLGSIYAGRDIQESFAEVFAAAHAKPGTLTERLGAERAAALEGPLGKFRAAVAEMGTDAGFQYGGTTVKMGSRGSVPGAARRSPRQLYDANKPFLDDYLVEWDDLHQKVHPSTLGGSVDEELAAMRAGKAVKAHKADPRDVEALENLQKRKREFLGTIMSPDEVDEYLEWEGRAVAKGHLDLDTIRSEATASKTPKIIDDAPVVKSVRDRLVDIWGDSIDFSGDTSGDLVVRNMQDLEKLDSRVVKLLRDSGIGVTISDSGVGRTAGFEHLRGVQPRGHVPGSTWDDVPGVYDFADKRVVIGVGGHATSSVAMHEIGHAFDHASAIASGMEDFGDATGWSRVDEWTSIHDRVMRNNPGLDPYFKQADGAGKAELFAEMHATKYFGTDDEWARLLGEGDEAVSLRTDIDDFFARAHAGLGPEGAKLMPSRPLVPSAPSGVHIPPKIAPGLPQAPARTPAHTPRAPRIPHTPQIPQTTPHIPYTTTTTPKTAAIPNAASFFDDIPKKGWIAAGVAVVAGAVIIAGSDRGGGKQGVLPAAPPPQGQYSSMRQQLADAQMRSGAFLNSGVSSARQGLPVHSSQY